MALYSCKCLNIVVECDKVEDVTDTEKLELSTEEQRDLFFSEKLTSCLANMLKCHVVQAALIGNTLIGRFNMQSCLACGQTTHAIFQEKSVILIKKSMQTTEQEINNLKKSSNFSPVFNLLVPEITNDVEMKENIDTNNYQFTDRNGTQPSTQLIGTLKKQLNQTLKTHLDEIEEAVNQFREQKLAEYEAYRERAHRDHKILSSILSRSNSNVDNDNWTNYSNVDNGPPTLLNSIQRRRLSSIKDSRKIPQIRANPPIPHEEDSLDAEDIFDLEGTHSRNNMVSDQDDYDSDDGSNDEGIHIERARGGGGARGDVAHSLPISMPTFPNQRPSVRDYDDYEETQDIAASIKALARSVHGDVYELPRPRFSTQI
ncbi:uncharacterized protein LOC121728582 [Aricia agestis]|uniref:uncharacterized protein LOC121728582 n=1 Tax=Aricia agestis TaxID=91739 RepID=UPI001C202FE4|nr:uncharacterized protein LOC121728582 [Aricia agestis]